MTDTIIRKPSDDYRSTEKGLGFGRNSAVLPPPDPKDKLFLMESAIDEPPPPRPYKYHFSEGWWGDQYSTPQCVSYSGLHYMEDGPITVAPKGRGLGPFISPYIIYKECQRVDEWPGEDYDGTSVRALMKVFKARGYISEYRWAWDLDTVVDWLHRKGPVILGSWWYRDMFYPNKHGLIKVHGGRVGGHAYLLNGVNLNTKIVRIKNSWGRDWGRRGHGYMTFGDLGRLIYENGEAAIALQAAA